MQFELHRAQSELWESPKRFKWLVAGRGAGKTRFGIYWLVWGAIQNRDYDPLSPPTALAVLPTLKQARKLIWKALLGLFEGPLSGYVVAINRTDLTIELKPPMATIKVAAGTGQALESSLGERIVRLWIDEFGSIPLSSWYDVFEPALRRVESGQALLTGSPRQGKASPHYRFRESLAENPAWELAHWKTEDNPYFPLEAIEEARQSLPPLVFAREYLGSFLDPKGQVWECFDPAKTVAHPGPFVKWFIAVDPGTAKFGALLVAVTADYHLHIQEAISDLKADWKALEPTIVGWCRDYPVSRIWVDAAASESRSRLKDAVVGAGLTVPVSATVKGPGSVLEGNRLVNILFWQGRIHLADHLDWVGHLLASYATAEGPDGERTDVPKLKQPDELPDCLRYITLSLTHKFEDFRKAWASL